MAHLTDEYRYFMKSEAWDKIRKKALRQAVYTCQRCGARDQPLDVHHLTYENFGGDEWPEDLEVLCRPCHKQEHSNTSWIFEMCQTCGELLLIFVEKMSGGWIRKTCTDGHIREKRQ